MRTLASSIFVLLFATFGSSTAVFAQATQTTGTNTSVQQTTGINTGDGVTLINPLKSGTSLESFLLKILDFVIKIGSIVIIFMVVYAGFKFVVAQGAPAKIDEAKQMLLWVIIGALVLLGAKGISLGILSTVQALGG